MVVPKPAPLDFASIARTMNISQAARTFGVDANRIKAWAQECDDTMLLAMLANGKEACRPRGNAAAKRAMRRIEKPEQEDTLDSRAMRHLQRETRWVCYSSRIYGHKEIVYYVGNQKLSLGELVSLAKQYGFEG